MSSLWEFLSGSETVASIQRCFGVEFVTSSEVMCRSTSDEEVDSNGVSDIKNAVKCTEHMTFGQSGNGRDTFSLSASSPVRNCNNGFVKMEYRIKDTIATSTIASTVRSRSTVQHNGRAGKGIILNSVSNTTYCPHNDRSTDYVIHNKFWYYIFLFGAMLGNEIFYMAFFPFCCWNVSVWVTRRVAIIWAIVMYFGQAAKDIVKWPRPSSPPVVKLEHIYNMEYGMPSTHAMMGLSLPFTLFLLTVQRFEYPYYLGVAIAVTWCTLVCISRLYLGMHNVLDVIAGLVLAAVLMAVIYPYLDVIEDIFINGKYGATLAFGIGISMAIFYPTFNKWTMSRGEATLLLGIGTGTLVGLWFKVHFNLPPFEPVGDSPYTITVPDLRWMFFMILKMSSGILILLATRFVISASIKKVAYAILRILPLNEKRNEQVYVEVPRKFFTYMAIAVLTASIIPYMHQCIGL
ncbi:sphingosine-1-phosphate phosphatase 2-like [Saccoglossus kowalevskii]|uniref:Sphingosine-1-phosphate phosphatase 2-like n=1 Tax=Saccoglossus kowalevskii TaxID=10224 RepID=A0ABM0MFN5_SACKO|nr:PREDICTED: sphingosine-1-phosphate phosphatase 2-like [Saccoglossus kowalevskii]